MSVQHGEEPRSPCGERWRVRGFRMLIVAVAVALAWCTSFTVAYILAASVIDSPSLSVVESHWHKARLAVEAKQDDTYVCKTAELDRCAFQLATATHRMDALLREQNISNTFALTNASALSASCAQAGDALVALLLRFQTDTSALSLRETCSASDREQVSTALRLPSFALVDEARASSSQFSVSSAASNSVFEASVEARVAYDRDYVRNKTQLINQVLVPMLATLSVNISRALEAISAVDPLQAIRPELKCLSFNETCELGFGAAQAVSDVLARALSSMAALEHVYNLNVFAAADYVATVEDLLAVISPIFDVLRDVAETITFDVARLPSLDVPPIALVGLPNLEDLPTIQGLSPNISKLTDMLSGSLLSLQNNLLFNVSNPLSPALGALQAISIDSPTFLTDYHPPPINFSRGTADASRDSFLAQQGATLTQLPGTTPSSSTAAPRAVHAGVFLAPSIKANFTLPRLHHWTFPAAIPSYGSVKSAVASIVVVVVVFDILYRIVQCLSIFRYYFFTMSHTLPDVDLRESEASSIGTCCRTWGSCAAVLGTPMLSLAALFVLITLISYFLATAYVSVYQSYVDGCVASRDGTLFSKNSVSIAEELVASATSYAMLDAQVSVDRSRTDTCQVRMVSETEALNGLRADLSNIRSAFNSSVSRSDAILSCINFSQLDVLPQFRVDASSLSDFLVSKCSSFRLDQYPLSFSSVLAASGPCLDVVSECRPDCARSSSEVAYETQQAACYTEYFVHSNVIRVVLAIFVFVAFNISRILVVDAFTRLLWKHLGVSTFGVTVSYGLDGEPAQLVEKADVQKHFMDRYRSWTVLSILGMVGSIVVHFPYIGVLLLLSDLQPPLS